MVFIHGGGFIGGSNSSVAFNPDYLLTEDVVLISMNYRLGMLGFLSLDDISLDIPGNAGLKDQNLALKWTQKNIVNFGGDPNNVTIFGVSAGGASAQYHVLSPASKGLFHKALIQSGSVNNPWAYGTASLLDILKVNGIEVDDEESGMEHLKGLSGKEICLMQEEYMKVSRYFRS